MAVLKSSLESPTTPQRSLPPLLTAITALTVIGIATGLYLALAYSGRDIEQGDVQRVFYIHMPAFFGAFVAFGATTLGGIQYLRTRQPRWDMLAVAGAEVGLVLSVINIATGSIWARPIWNTWWNWDPRLTSAAVMILTYAAYLMLRAAFDNVEQRRRFAAIYGILAITSVVLTLIIPRIVPSSIHPIVIGPVFNGTEAFAQGDFELAATPGVGLSLAFHFLVWTVLLPVTLLWHRQRLEAAAERVRAFKQQVLG